MRMRRISMLCSVALLLPAFGLAQPDSAGTPTPARPSTSPIRADAIRQEVAADGALFLLMESGNIHRRVGGATDLLDPGTGTKQIAAGDGYLFALKDGGNLWATSLARIAWKQIDDGQLTRGIACLDRSIYVVKEKGQVFGAGVSQIQQARDVISWSPVRGAAAKAVIRSMERGVKFGSLHQASQD